MSADQDFQLQQNASPALMAVRSSVLLARIETMTNQDIQLICGEMSRQELRTARALLDWVAREMRANDPSSATGRENP